MSVLDDVQHGTPDGLARHEELGEILCRPCWDVSRGLKPCGSVAAYRRHVRRGEPADQACLDAVAQQNADARRRRKTELARDFTRGGEPS